MECSVRIETIKCPKCGKVQEATIKECSPWDSFVHHCCNCRYVIMESEWENVTVFKKSALRSFDSMEAI